MSIVKLGFEPNTGQLILSPDADWICTLVEDGVTWPASTTCRLEFPSLAVGPYSATVTISTATAAFHLDKTVTGEADIPGDTEFNIYLVKGGTDDFLWFTGKVKRKGAE